jgi:hypothetical protein
LKSNSRTERCHERVGIVDRYEAFWSDFSPEIGFGLVEYFGHDVSE